MGGDDRRAALAGRSFRQLCLAEWFADPPAARRPHRQEIAHPGFLDVLRRVSAQNAGGTDRGDKSSRLWKIEPPNHCDLQTVSNQRSNRALPSWRQDSIGFRLPKIGRKKKKKKKINIFLFFFFIFVLFFFFLFC